MNSRPNPPDAADTADELFADLPAFDIVDGELMPRPPRRGAPGEKAVDAR